MIWKEVLPFAIFGTEGTTMSRFVCLLMVGLLASVSVRDVQAELRVGATVIDVTPLEFPVLVNGSMVSRSASTVKTPVNARVIVLDDGTERIGIAVVDSCMLPRMFLDDAKHLIAQETKLKPNRILISATHTHSAPSCMGALGTDADEQYIPFLRQKLIDGFVAAEKNLEPAKVGWGVGQAPHLTALRRWVRRPDRLADDPFGNPTVRANMHAGRNPDDVTGESGPEDPSLSLISFQSLDGRPIAVLANFSMHYFSDTAISADYFGLFSEGLKTRIAPIADGHPAFVGMMSHGCSGDIWRRDYKQAADAPWQAPKIDEYTEELLDIAIQTYEGIEYEADADLAMQEHRLELNYRVPDAQRLEWAKGIVAELGENPPKTLPEVYAREQVILDELQSTEVVVQGIRIGDIAIATTPNETYALTGLKVKHQSPLDRTMVIELANGGDGYIPPPEQHILGGYNTWAARSAGLEVEAEPKIVEAALSALEIAAGKVRRPDPQPLGKGAKAVLDLKPVAYWRMDEMAGPVAVDETGSGHNAFYEDGVVFYLEGPTPIAFSGDGNVNRAAHFAGGRMRTQMPSLKGDYTVSMWCWNGIPVDARETAGWMFSRGHAHGVNLVGDHLGLSGTAQAPGRLLYSGGGEKTLVGKTELNRWEWVHVAMVREGEQIRVYLNGKLDIEAPVEVKSIPVELFVGGRCDGDSSWEGRIDEVAIFDRALEARLVRSISLLP